MKRPRVTLRCPADVHAAPRERIVEFSSSRGVGGLIALRECDDGTLVVVLYRLDPEVRVAYDGGHRSPRRAVQS